MKVVVWLNNIGLNDVSSYSISGNLMTTQFIIFVNRILSNSLPIFFSSLRSFFSSKMATLQNLNDYFFIKK